MESQQGKQDKPNLRILSKKILQLFDYEKGLGPFGRPRNPNINNPKINSLKRDYFIVIV